MNKKGLASGILVLIFIMFMFAMFSLIALKGWDVAENAFLSIDGVSNETKAEISELRTKMVLGDKLFIFGYIALLITYLITARTLPSDKPEVLLIFIVFLILVCIVAMFFTNTWDYITSLGVFEDQVDDFKFTNHFMKFYPVYTFFVGISGAAIFFTKGRDDIAAIE